MGHVVVPELSRALVAGAGATGHVAVLELSCVRRWEPGPWGTWRSRSCRHEALATPELPCARRWVLWDTQACVPVLPFVFDLKPVREGI
jgi:hypothetical protein